MKKLIPAILAAFVMAGVAMAADGWRMRGGGSSSASVNGSAISPTVVTTNVIDAGSARIGYIDAGYINITGSAEVQLGLKSSSGGITCIGLNQGPGLNCAAPYMYFNQGSGGMFIAGTSDLTVQSGSGNTVNVSAGAAGAIAMTGSKSVGSCTLNGASPSTCTATVRSGSKCTCSNVATGAVYPGVVTTTLTCTGPNGSAADTNYFCF